MCLERGGGLNPPFGFHVQAVFGVGKTGVRAAGRMEFLCRVSLVLPNEEGGRERLQSWYFILIFYLAYVERTGRVLCV